MYEVGWSVKWESVGSKLIIGISLVVSMDDMVGVLEGSRLA